MSTRQPELPLQAARDTLGLGAACTEAELKQAYRTAVRNSPPDRDPQGFQRVRAAYEALRHPLQLRESWLLHRLPIRAPTLREPPGAQEDDVARVALRKLLQDQRAEDLLPNTDLDSVHPRD